MVSKYLPLVLSAWMSVVLLCVPASAVMASTGTLNVADPRALLSGETQDWPQLQGDAQRTGRTPLSIAPPYRARWIWLGPGQVLRNKDSHPAWKDDLTSRNGHSFPMPAKVGHTIARSVQPIVSKGRLFFATQEGKAYALSTDDGSTVWSATLPGGTNATAATDGNTVVFVSMPGTVYGFHSPAEESRRRSRRPWHFFRETTAS